LTSTQHGSVRPFRFIATMPRLDQPAGAWRDAVRRIEESGFSTVSVSDHFTKGWVMEPTVAMMAAADVTRRLRILSLVLGNDYRHPVLLHKAMATIDVLSQGRLEVGIGAGWMVSDYEAAGIAYDPPGIRVERLAESVRILKGLFGPSAVTFVGNHYHIRALDGLPKPVQEPHPPLLIGGGGRRMLSLAASEADIVGLHANLRQGALTQAAVADLSAERVEEKLRWMREAATAAGRSMDTIELQLSLYICRITNARSTAQASVSSFAAHLHTNPALLEQSPAVLCGSLQQCVETLQERRERYGFSYVNLGGDVEATAPLVARLAGT
jgi:probable F420-dependent oxidoreductase